MLVAAAGRLLLSGARRLVTIYFVCSTHVMQRRARRLSPLNCPSRPPPNQQVVLTAHAAVGVTHVCYGKQQASACPPPRFHHPPLHRDITATLLHSPLQVFNLSLEQSSGASVAPWVAGAIIANMAGLSSDFLVKKARREFRFLKPSFGSVLFYIFWVNLHPDDNTITGNNGWWKAPEVSMGGGGGRPKFFG